MEYNQSEFLIETEVPDDELIISRTDLKGNITHANDIFCEISGYEIFELKGKAHSIVRHPDMPASIFADLWETITNKKQWRGVVKNIRKDGGFYWVDAIVSGVYKDGELFNLSPNELKLFEFFIKNLGNKILKEDILYHLHNGEEGSENALRVYISRLKKLGLKISNQRGVGYCCEEL